MLIIVAQQVISCAFSYVSSPTIADRERRPTAKQSLGDARIGCLDELSACLRTTTAATWRNTEGDERS